MLVESRIVPRRGTTRHHLCTPPTSPLTINNDVHTNNNTNFIMTSEAISANCLHPQKGEGKISDEESRHLIGDDEWEQFRASLVEKGVLTGAAVSVAWGQRKLSNFQPKERKSFTLRAKKKKRRESRKRRKSIVVVAPSRQQKGNDKRIYQHNEPLRWKVLDATFQWNTKATSSPTLVTPKKITKNSNLIDLCNR